MNNTRLKEIEERMEYIRNKNAHWKSCQDGSYEMAMDMDGYYKLRDEYQQLKESQGVENAN